MKKVKVLVIILLVLSLIFMVIGCQNNKHLAKDEQNKKNQSKSSLPEKLENPDLRILIWTEDILKGWTPIMNMFEEKYGGKVSYDMVAWNQYAEKIVAGVASGNGYDTVRWAAASTPSMMIKGVLQPVDEFYDFTDPMWADYIENMEQFKYKGKHYGVAGGGGMQFMVIYNKTLFENNGVKTPLEYYKEGKWNWEILRELGIKMTQDTDRDGTIDQWGLGQSSAERFVLSNGTFFVKTSDDGSATIAANDPKVIEALQFYQDAMIKDKYMPTKNLPNGFQSGKVAMITDRNLKVTKDMKYEWDFVPFPKGPSATKFVSPATQGMYGITVAAPNPKGGAVFQYMRKMMADDPELKAKYNLILEEEDLGVELTPEQEEIMAEIKKSYVVSKYNGYGINMNPLWNGLKNGTPPMTLIEQFSPTWQAAIDSTLKDIN